MIVKTIGACKFLITPNKPFYCYTIFFHDFWSFLYYNSTVEEIFEYYSDKAISNTLSILCDSLEVKNVLEEEFKKHWTITGMHIPEYYKKEAEKTYPHGTCKVLCGPFISFEIEIDRTLGEFRKLMGLVEDLSRKGYKAMWWNWNERDEIGSTRVIK